MFDSSEEMFLFFFSLQSSKLLFEARQAVRGNLSGVHDPEVRADQAERGLKPGQRSRGRSRRPLERKSRSNNRYVRGKPLAKRSGTVFFKWANPSLFFCFFDFSTNKHYNFYNRYM